MQNCFVIKRSSLTSPLDSHIFSPTTTDEFPITIILSLHECRINGIIQYATLWDWLFSLIIVPLRSIHKIRWDVFGLEGPSNTLLHSRRSCVFPRPVSLSCAPVGLCCWCLLTGRGFKWASSWWLGHSSCSGSVATPSSWVHPESLVGYNKWVRKSPGLQTEGKKHLASPLTLW